MVVVHPPGGGAAGAVARPDRTSLCGVAAAAAVALLSLPRIRSISLFHPAHAAEDCPGSPSCRSTTAGVVSLLVLQQPCASSGQLEPGLAIGPCQTVAIYDGGPTPGSCDGEPDGYTYLHIQ